MPALLKRGSRGEEVKKLQLILNKLYPTCELRPILRANGTADGVFGSITDAWVYKFQVDNPPLKRDYKVGPNTWRALSQATPRYRGSVNKPVTPANKEQVIGPDRYWSELSVKEQEEAIDSVMIGLPRDGVPRDLKSIARYVAPATGGLIKVGQLANIFAGAAATTLPWFGAASVPSTVVSSLLAWDKALSTNKDMYTCRAWAYTVTAWVFDFNRGMPKSSPEMMKRFEENRFPEDLKSRVKAWKRKSHETWLHLDTQARRSKVTKEYLRINIMHLIRKDSQGRNFKENLCYELLRLCENNFNGISKYSWKDGYSVLYPR